MGIFDVTDSFESQIKMEEPLVTFANQGKDVIYREQL